MGGDWPWFVWLMPAPFFSEWDWQWATENAPCWLTATCR
ncbi:Integral membrane protein [Prescottella defluvii]